MASKSTPPVIDGDFLRVCLQYEYLKTKNSHEHQNFYYIASVNMSQMFVSKSLRNNIPPAEDLEDTAGPSQSAPEVMDPLVPMFHAEGSDYSGVLHQEPREAYELGAYIQIDEGLDQQGSSQSWSNLGQTPLDPRTYTPDQNLPRPPKVRRGLQNLEDLNPGQGYPEQNYSNLPGTSSEAYNSRQDNEESSDPNQPGPSNPPAASAASKPLEPNPEDFFPEKIKMTADQLKSSLNPQKPRIHYDLIKWETRTENEEVSVVTPLKLLKQGEEDVEIDIVSSETIHDWFVRFLDNGTLEPEIPVRKTKRLLREVRSMAYTFFGPTVQLQDTRNFILASKRVDDLKITIGFGGIKMEWAEFKYSNKKLITLEYWIDTEGCWLWNNDDVRFIEGFKYELLACHEFINIVRYLKWYDCRINLNHLEFEFERQTKWNFRVKKGVRYFFSRNIKRWMENHQEQFPTSVFSMTLYEEAPPEYQPFSINLLVTTETIRLRVWKGAKVGDDYKTVITALNYLEEQAKARSWRLASVLSMVDEKLKTFTEADFSGFERIYFWNANVEFVRCLIEKKLANFHYSDKGTVLKVYEEFRIADFHEALVFGNFENGVYVEKGEKGTIRVSFDEKEKRIKFVVS